MNHFPLELTSAVLNLVEDSDKNSLLLCRLVSKDFQGLVTPRAFRTLNISRKKGCHVAFTKLALAEYSDTPHVSPLVHVKEINFRGVEVGGWVYEYVFDGDKTEETVSMFQYLASFPNLQTLRLYFPDVYEESLYQFDGQMSPARRLQIEIFKTLAEAKFELQELQVHGLLQLPNEGARLDGFRSFLHPIKKLYISLITNDDEDFDIGDEDYTAFWDTDIPQLIAATSNLTSLTLASDIDTLGFGFNKWDEITLPRLEHLCLRNIVFVTDANTGVEQFIVRHGRTLVHLDLMSCNMDVDDPNPRTWAEVWNRFEQELNQLCSFSFSPLPGRPQQRRQGPEDEHDGRIFHGYVTFIIEWGYRNKFGEPPADEDVDRLAFESFQRCIATRNGRQE